MKKTDKPVFSSEHELFEGMKENHEVITRTEIPNTPFTIIGTEQGYFGCIGRHRITEVKETEREIIEELDVQPTWDRITQVVLILIDTLTKQQQ